MDRFRGLVGEEGPGLELKDPGLTADSNRGKVSDPAPLC